MNTIELTNPVVISPSILACDLCRIGEEVEAMETAGVDSLHLDIMDGHFVPNITFGFPIIECLRKHSSLPFDAHLMITNPERYIEDFARLGCYWLSVHVEATSNISKTLERIKELGMKAGIAISPGTPLSTVDHVLSTADFFVIMGVHPGFAGQKFLENSLNRVRYLKQKIGSGSAKIEIDGGIKRSNFREAVLAGASMIVMGTGLFGCDDYKKEVQALRKLAD